MWPLLKMTSTLLVTWMEHNEANKFMKSECTLAFRGECFGFLGAQEFKCDFKMTFSKGHLNL